MKDRITHWLINICLIGLIPVIARLFVWLISVDGVAPLAMIDFVVFGLVLQSFTVNEISKIPQNENSWRTIYSGIAIIMTLLFGVLLFATIADPNTLNRDSLFYTTMGMALASFALSFAVLLSSDQPAVDRRPTNETGRAS